METSLLPTGLPLNIPISHLVLLGLKLRGVKQAVAGISCIAFLGLHGVDKQHHNIYNCREITHAQKITWPPWETEKLLKHDETTVHTIIRWGDGQEQEHVLLRPMQVDKVSFSLASSEVKSSLLSPCNLITELWSSSLMRLISISSWISRRFGWSQMSLTT